MMSEFPRPRGNAIWDYPFVAGLVQFSDDVRSVFDAAGLYKPTNYQNRISYAADWSSWTGVKHDNANPPSGVANGVQWPHLNHLWSHTNIDIVAFDNYLVIFEWTTGPSRGCVATTAWSAGVYLGLWPPPASQMSVIGLTGRQTIYSKAHLSANIEAGELVNWFYSDSSNNRGRDPFGSDLLVSLPKGVPQSRHPYFPNLQILGQKQIRWWNNLRYVLYALTDNQGFNPHGPQTEWIPQSNPIVFTEYSFPACDKSTNQPNVFFDPKSTESFTAFWSKRQPSQGGFEFLPKPDENLPLFALQAFYAYCFMDGNNETSGSGVPLLEPAFCSVWKCDAKSVSIFPQLCSVREDAGNWQVGNWLTRKGPYLILNDNLPEPPVPFHFPSLPGLGWSVHKRPTFSTCVSSHASRRKVRSPLYLQGLYEFEQTIESSNGAFPGVGARPLQALMGLYIPCQGQYGSFLFVAPTDNAATGASAGYGNGITTAFTLQRVLGSSTEAVSRVTALNKLYLDGVAQPTGWTLSTPNTLAFTNPPLGAARRRDECNRRTQHKSIRCVASCCHNLLSGDDWGWNLYLRCQLAGRWRCCGLPSGILDRDQCDRYFSLANFTSGRRDHGRFHLRLQLPMYRRPGGLRANQKWTGSVILFKGRIGTIDSIGRTSAQITVNSDLILLDLKMPRNVYSPNCQHVLYDSGCALIKRAFGTNGTVGSGPTTLINNLSGAITNFTQGTILFSSGVNNGKSANIKSVVASASLNLSYPLNEMPAAGDAFTAYWGCDHTNTPGKTSPTISLIFVNSHMSRRRLMGTRRLI